MTIFENTPFKFLASHLVKNEDFQADLRLILELPEDIFLRLAATLEKADMFIGRAALERIVSETLDNKEQATRLATIIYRIAEILHSSDMPLSEMMEVLSGAMAGSKQQTKFFTPEDRPWLIERLRRLIVVPTGFARQFKAQKLATATGAELDKLQIICDIRPIFDSNRSKVDGALPLAVMRLEYTAADGESMVLEVRVTERLIETLETTSAMARRKVGLIKELLASQNIPIPAIKAAL